MCDLIYSTGIEANIKIVEHVIKFTVNVKFTECVIIVNLARPV